MLDRLCSFSELELSHGNKELEQDVSFPSLELGQLFCQSWCNKGHFILILDLQHLQIPKKKQKTSTFDFQLPSNYIVAQVASS